MRTSKVDLSKLNGEECLCTVNRELASDHHHMWTLLRRIKPRSTEPWMLVGDFNEAMWQHEHLSRSRRSEWLMKDFRDVLSHCDVHDLGFVGNPWTYDNLQQGARKVRVRLDRAVASPTWSLCYPDVRVLHLRSSRSDHCPLLICTERETNNRPSRPVRRYEVAWEREPTLAAAIEEAWARRPNESGLGGISSAFNTVMGSLYSWRSK
jgi:hypothetical protein